MAKQYSPAAYKRRKLMRELRGFMNEIEASRVNAVNDLNGVGFYASGLLEGSMSMSAAQLREVAERLVELEKEYDISEIGTDAVVALERGLIRDYNGVDLGKDVVAATMSEYESMDQKIIFNGKLSYNELNDSIGSMRGTRHIMPYDEGRTTPSQYIAAHEYGHAVQHVLLARTSVDNSLDARFEQEVHRRKIIGYAEKHNGGWPVDAHMSTYGQTSAAEFFAEAFANAHSGKPNAIGKGMLDFLAEMKGHGLLGGGR